MKLLGYVSRIKTNRYKLCFFLTKIHYLNFITRLSVLSCKLQSMSFFELVIFFERFFWLNRYIKENNLKIILLSFVTAICNQMCCIFLFFFVSKFPSRKKNWFLIIKAFKLTKCSQFDFGKYPLYFLLISQLEQHTFWHVVKDVVQRL